MAARTLR